MPEFSKNLWAPWRMEYIDSLGEAEGADAASGGGCFLCRYRDEREADVQNHVLWRSRSSLVLLNRFPYTSGHVLVAPAAHQAELEGLSESELLDLTRCVRDAKRVLAEALKPQGFNVGMNLGRCAGAGLPGHLHWHIVPRWGGDTNFMAVVGDVRVIPQALQAAYEQCRKAAQTLGLNQS